MIGQKFAFIRLIRSLSAFFPDFAENSKVLTAAMKKYSSKLDMISLAYAYLCCLERKR